MYVPSSRGVLILKHQIFQILYSLKSTFTHSSLHLQQKLTLGIFTVVSGAFAQQCLEVHHHACQGEN